MGQGRCKPVGLWCKVEAMLEEAGAAGGGSSNSGWRSPGSGGDLQEGVVKGLDRSHRSVRGRERPEQLYINKKLDSIRTILH